jgi:hypothetical protein
MDDGTVTDMSADQTSTMPAAATFTPATTNAAAQAREALKAPTPPTLIDERTAKGADDLDDIRDKNTATVKGYNKEYGAYLERTADFVRNAPDSKSVRALGKPVDYAPFGKMPVEQQRNYPGLFKSSLESQMSTVKDALGLRISKDKGLDLPNIRGSLELQGTAFGNGARLTRTGTDGTTKSDAEMGLGASTDMLHLMGAHVPFEASVTRWDRSTEISGSAGSVFGSIERQDGGIGKTVDVGYKAGAVEAGVTGGTTENGEYKAGAVVGVSAHGFEAKARATAEFNTLTLKPEDLAVAIDPNGKDFYDDLDASVNANRPIGS